MKNRPFPYVQVNKKQEKRIRAGHPWVYAEEITDSSENIENGSVTDVFGTKGQYLGSGFYSSASKIRVRILSGNANETFSDDFFRRRVQYALKYRHDVMAEDMRACRLIHGEADGLPGLTVDLYEDTAVAEVLSYGMDLKKKIVFEALKEELTHYGIRLRGIYERNEGELRTKEGLSRYKGWYGEDCGETKVGITENGIRYLVDIENGQKTGFFLDQKYNRRAVRRLAEGRKVLDCCTHIGTFALNAAAAGASHVTAVDISAAALESARDNAVLNGLEDRISFAEADVFDYLEEAKRSGSEYDMIILDPPAFTKSRKTAAAARSGYRRINYLAMRILGRGGYLATASCSHFMPTAEFKQMLKEAADDAGVSLRIAEERHASFDHPVLVGVDETEYLKFFILQII